MPTKPVPVYWDSCVYIDCIQKHPTRYPRLAAILDDATSGRIIFVASALVIAEVVKLKLSEAPVADQAHAIGKFFENDYIEIKSVDRRIAEEAAELCRNHTGLKPPDAIHIATALRWECRRFQTYDGANDDGTKTRLLALDGQIGWPRLKIEEPQRLFRDQGGLFVADEISPPDSATTS